MRGTEGALYFKFRGYQTRYLSNMLNLAKNSGPEGKAAFVWMMAGLATVAGVSGLPFVQDIENGGDAVWKALGHVDPMIDAHLRQALADTGLGKFGAEVLLRGIPSVALGTDLSSGFGFGELLSRPVSPADIAGVVPSMMYQAFHNGLARYDTAQGAASVAAEALPAALRNPAEAYIQGRQGIVSPSGAMELPAGKISPADTAKRALGFTPLAATQERANSEFAYNLKAHDEELRQDVVRSVAMLAMRASNADRNGDRAGADALRAQAQGIIAKNSGLMISGQAYKNAEFEMMDPEMYRLTRTPMRERAQVQNSPYP
jgi:hypothetical protein